MQLPSVAGESLFQRNRMSWGCREARKASIRCLRTPGTQDVSVSRDTSHPGSNAASPDMDPNVV